MIIEERKRNKIDSEEKKGKWCNNFLARELKDYDYDDGDGEIKMIMIITVMMIIFWSKMSKVIRLMVLAFLLPN